MFMQSMRKVVEGRYSANIVRDSSNNCTSLRKFININSMLADRTLVCSLIVTIKVNICFPAFLFTHVIEKTIHRVRKLKKKRGTSSISSRIDVITFNKSQAV